MGNKETHIRHWVEGAEKNHRSAEILIAGEDYLLALFCWHLCIEKLLKALWVKNNQSNFPPRTHNLVWLNDTLQLDLPDEIKKSFELMNYWNIEGRYPEYTDGVYKIATKQYIDEKRPIVENARICLISKLQ